MQEQRLAQALAAHVGEILTPETAARILAFSVGGVRIKTAALQWGECGRLTFEAVHFSKDIQDLLHPLQLEYWAEAGEGEMRLDYADLERRDARGDLLQFIAWDNDKPAGFIRVFLSHSLDTGKRIAMEHAVYLRHPYRVGRTLPQFVQYVETCLQQIGVKQVRIQAARRHGLPVLAQRLGYRPTHTVLVKDLE